MGRPSRILGRREACCSAFVVWQRDGLLSRASEPERSAVTIEHKVTIDNLQGLRPKVDFADVVRFETELDDVAGTRIELHRLTCDLEDLQHQPDSRRGIRSGERQ